jgi:hypothetical protein
MKLVRMLASTSVAVVMLSALVGTSSAGRLSSSSQTFRAGFARWDFAGGFGTTECALTLEGSLHSRTIVKTVGSLIGYITRAVLGACSRGEATILTASLPWHVRYASFSGSLPVISMVNATVAGAQFEIREPVFGVTCLASGGTGSLVFTRETTNGVLTTLQIGGESPTDCGVNGRQRGISNSLTVLGAATRITVTLI